MEEYRITISFGGFIGCENEYTVFADSREEAEKLALHDAMDDLEVESVEIEED